MGHKELPLVVIQWADAWVKADEAVTLQDAKTSHGAAIVTTLGWVLIDDESGVSLANEKYDDTYRGRTFIPRAMVQSMTTFVLAKPRKKKGSSEEGA